MLDDNKRVASIVFSSLENERCLDLRYKVTHGPAGNFLNYKVMKQNSLRQRFGKLLTPALLLFAVLIPALLFIQWISAIFVSLLKYSTKRFKQTIWLVPTVPSNQALIYEAVSDNSCNFDVQALSDLNRQLAGLLGPKQVLFAVEALYIVLKNALLAKGRRIEMILHSRDALSLILLAFYAQRCDGDIFATDDHYQRWAFILSHCAQNFYLVQHGELDDGIVFPHTFGIINRAYIRNEMTLKTLRNYYSVVEEGRLYYPAVKLTSNAYGDTGVFIASSSPSIQSEIDFVRALRASHRAPIIVKLHPAHYYDKRKKILCSFADHVCTSNEIPECCVFVSYSSSMEQLYQLQGISTVSISMAGDVHKAVQLTLDILNR